MIRRTAALAATGHETTLRRTATALATLVLAVTACSPSLAQSADTTVPRGTGSGLTADLKAYVTAPLRWRSRDWLRFGSALGAVSLAYQYDSRTRDHFVTATKPSLGATDRRDLEDALPAALALGGTWIAAAVMDDRDGRAEARSMLESAVLSTATSYVLKESFGRRRPYDEAGRGSWSDGGDSFPSAHVAAAFAIGTVLAESGGSRYRWVRRVLGYGIGLGTAYARVEHDAHWLSDTVGGAGIGIATARFVIKRDRGRDRRGETLLLPTDGGIVVAYTVSLER